MSSQDKPIQRLMRWISGQLVQTVPPEDAICAFDCKKGQCTVGEWAVCGRRLHRAAGELMPATDPGPATQVEPAPEEPDAIKEPASAESGR
jgi:hypothetical protein